MGFDGHPVPVYFTERGILHFSRACCARRGKPVTVMMVRSAQVFGMPWCRNCSGDQIGLAVARNEMIGTLVGQGREAGICQSR